jgi:hypothetical protein
VIYKFKLNTQYGFSSSVLWSPTEYFLEFVDHKTSYWKKFVGRPNIEDLIQASTVVHKKIDGTYEYIRNSRENDSIRLLTEQEVIWLLLKI